MDFDCEGCSGYCCATSLTPGWKEPSSKRILRMEEVSKDQRLLNQVKLSKKEVAGLLKDGLFAALEVSSLHDQGGRFCFTLRLRSVPKPYSFDRSGFALCCTFMNSRSHDCMIYKKKYRPLICELYHQLEKDNPHMASELQEFYYGRCTIIDFEVTPKERSRMREYYHRNKNTDSFSKYHISTTDIPFRQGMQACEAAKDPLYAVMRFLDTPHVADEKALEFVREVEADVVPWVEKWQERCRELNQTP